VQGQEPQVKEAGSSYLLATGPADVPPLTVCFPRCKGKVEKGGKLNFHLKNLADLFLSHNPCQPTVPALF
jgi:hypothetical protein